MTDSIEQRVREVIVRLAGIAPSFPADADLFREIGIKSGTALDLLLSLEEDFSLAIPDEAFGEARSLTKLVALVSELQERSP